VEYSKHDYTLLDAEQVRESDPVLARAIEQRWRLQRENETIREEIKALDTFIRQREATQRA
jgi:hypothetical protein